MGFPILGANTESAAYEISNSLRFNKADSAKLSFTQGTPTSRRTWTYSTWVKRGNLADQQESILSWGDEDFFDVRFQDGTPDDGIIVYISDGDSKSLATNRLFRDSSAWYHIVIASDTTDGTAGDRTRIYVNGVEETSFASEAQPDQNYDYRGLVSGDPIVIGNRYTGSHYFDGYLADTHFIDGQQLAPSNFGETNDNGVWIPKKYLGTYGTNGFKLEYKQTGTSANASGIGADTSGNDNHFSVTNLAETDVTTDTPTNNFATLNPLQSSASASLSEGNTKHTNNGGNDQASAATMGFASGKWYWEVKCVDKAEVGINLNSDILQLSNDSTVGFNDANVKATALVTNSAGGSNDLRHNGGNETITSVSVADNDIISIAVDADNGKIWFAKNGTYFNSGDPAAGSNEAKDFSGAYTSGNFIIPVNLVATGDGDIYEINFGNPSFSISSGNSDANGYGNFEYAVPSGYYALCTKNLAEYG